MFGFGLIEILVIAVIALIFIGPDQLPEVARVLGRFLNELRRATESVKQEIKQSTFDPNQILKTEEQKQQTDHQPAGEPQEKKTQINHEDDDK